MALMVSIFSGKMTLLQFTVENLRHGGLKLQVLKFAAFFYRLLVIKHRKEKSQL